MGVKIHPTALVEKGAELGEGVVVGPFCLVGPNVIIGDRCTLISHVNITGKTIIGRENQFHPFTTIGVEPQDLTYKSEPTCVQIGDKNIIREYVSIHRGTARGSGVTKMGNENLLMSYTHLGHDVSMGEKNVIVNSVNLGGHVRIENKVVIGGGSGVSQFLTVSEGAYIGGNTIIHRDIPPFCVAYGNRARLRGINIIGLRRQGHPKEIVSELVDFYRTMEASVLSPRAFVDNEELMAEFNSNELVKKMGKFISTSKSGIAPFVD